MFNAMNGWIVPTWHPDFGDPIKPFNMLLEFCQELSKHFPLYVTKLDCYEEGGMNVDIFLRSVKLAELHVVVDNESNGYRYGLFYEETIERGEFYFKDIQDGIDFFAVNVKY